MSGSRAPRRGMRLLVLSAAVALAVAWGLIWPDGALAETFTVTNTKDAGKGSLRKAILNANGRMGADTIRFRIDGRGVKTIRPQSPLPGITTDALTIDGYTQPGAKRNSLTNGTNAKLKIQIDGTNAGETASGLVIGGDADGSRISGLVINRFGRIGIAVETSGNSVSGNFIGTNVAGNADLGNGGIGVAVGGDADENLIGGEFNSARNLISGNDDHGVRIDSFSAQDNGVRGNLIGTNAAGDAALGNAGMGVALTDGTLENTIGGTSEGSRNVISANGRDGVLMVATDSVVLGNFIGTDATGNVDLGNTESGISIQSGGGHLIGGPASGAGNVISGNGEDGITLSSTNNTIQGNRVGTDVDGTADLGNTVDGVSMSNASGNTVGGTEGTAPGGPCAGACNVISGNREEGVRLVGAGAINNEILGNFIGTNAAGSPGLGNSSDGVLIIAGASGNTVGGTAGGAGNVISSSPAAGVQVDGAGTTGNSILSNAIFANTGLGIDLGASGVTANDGDNPLTPAVVETDTDTGANNLQNFPEIQSATKSSTTLTVTGSLQSTPHRTFTIQVFGAAPGGSGESNGEGRRLLCQTEATTDRAGNTPVFTCSANVGILTPDSVTATATSTVTGDTSEFAENFAVR